MNYKNMNTETLARIFKEVRTELDNRECRDQASAFQAYCAHVRAELKKIEDCLDREPRRVKNTTFLKPGLEDLVISIENFWDEKGIFGDA